MTAKPSAKHKLPHPIYIWQHHAWPDLLVDGPVLAHDLDAARLQQGKLLGALEAIGLRSKPDMARDLWVQEALATAAIEGEKLDLEAVRSSVAHRLGLADAPAHDRQVDGLVEVMEDATRGHAQALDDDRLWRWQSALFPGGTQGVRRLAVGRYRDQTDPMQIVSGRLGQEVVHYVAPPSGRVPAEMQRFLAWFEATRPATSRARAPARAVVINGLVRAAIAHVWFEAIHPFEDGNGRLGRAIVDMALAQEIGMKEVLAPVFGMARQMLTARGAYYDALNSAQRPAPGAKLDVTPWVRWFVQAFTQGCITSQGVVRHAIDTNAFRQQATQAHVNERQLKVLNRLLEAGCVGQGGGFLGGMTAEKYSKITGASKPTATRDLADLVAKELLVVAGRGKATRYAVNVPGWTQLADA
jgi:Fic family protein